MAKFKDLDIITTVGTSVITNKIKYGEIPDIIKHYTNYTLKKNIIHCRPGDEKESTQIYGFINRIKDLYSSGENYKKSAEVETIDHIIDEDYEAYEFSTEHSEELLERLKAGYDSLVDLKIGKEVKSFKPVEKLAKIYAISPVGVKNTIKTYIQENVGPKNKKLQTLINDSFVRYDRKKIKVTIHKNVRIRFVATDSLLGIVAASILFNLTKDEEIVRGEDSDFVEVHYKINSASENNLMESVFQIQGLDVTNPEVFVGKGVSELFTVLYNILENNDREVSFNMTGGYKGVIPYFTMFAQINHIPSYYMFDGAKMMKLPLIDISISQQFAEDHYIELKQFTKSKHKTNLNRNSSETIDKLMHNNLIFQHEGDYELTGLGSLVNSTIKDIETQVSNFGTIYEKFIYSHFLDNKDTINKKYFSNESKVSIVSNVKFLTALKSSYQNAELDILMVNQNGEYLISEIKSIGSIKHIDDQVKKYFKLMESLLKNENEYLCENKDIIPRLKHPKEINVILVADKEDFRVSALFNKDNGQNSSLNWFEKVNGIFKYLQNKTDSVTMKKVKLRFTIADMSVISAQKKVNNLTLYDYDKETEDWETEGTVYKSSSSYISIQ